MTKEELGESLRALLASSRFKNKAELARAANVTQANLGRWLSGQHEPRGTELLQVMLALQVGPQEVVNGQAPSSEKGRHLEDEVKRIGASLKELEERFDRLGEAATKKGG